MIRQVSRRGKLALVPALGAAMALAALAPAGASSHREAPLTSEDPVIDNTDVYAFVSPDKPDTVTLIANWIPFEEPAGGPNFYRFGDDVNYRINIDNNGDAVDDIVYEFRFQSKILNPNTFLYATGPIKKITDPTYNFRQTYSVARVEQGKRTMLASGLLKPPDNVGPVSTPNYSMLASQGIYRVGDGNTQVFAGQRDDPFFVDLGSIFDLAQLRPFLPAYKPDPRPSRPGKDAVAGYNVDTIALQVPMKDLTHNGRNISGAKDPNAIIGVYSSTERRRTTVLSATGQQPTTSGPFTQVSRLGSPLINELFIPLGMKDKFNASEPRNDAQFLKYFLNPEPGAIINKLYGIPVPSNRNKDLVPIFLTGIPGLNQPANVVPSELLRLNMGIPSAANPNPLGLLGGDTQGFPNGRRLTDDVVDIELRAAVGGTPFTPAFNVSPNNDLGDGVNNNDRQFKEHFPYVAEPFQGFENTHGAVGSTNTRPLSP